MTTRKELIDLKVEYATLKSKRAKDVDLMIWKDAIDIEMMSRNIL